MEYTLVQGNLESRITDVVFDYRKVTQGNCFVCIQGQSFDGHNFISKAIDLGASVIIIERDMPHTNTHVTIIKVASTKEALSLLSSNFWNNPSQKMNLIGITGTNGKTSVANI